MATAENPWDEGRLAWSRLIGWDQDGPRAKPGHHDDGDAAAKALTDIGLVRRLLDQAELVAVKTARAHGKTWAEIATMLGVTRQSAWERWREFDDKVRPAATKDAPTARRRSDAVSEASGRAARELILATTESKVVVPNVIGLTWDDARQVLDRARLVAVGPDPDGPPLGALGWPDGVVVDQRPKAGERRGPGSSVTIWLERGPGSAGVREPRRPSPSPRTVAGMVDEVSGESIG